VGFDRVRAILRGDVLKQELPLRDLLERGGAQRDRTGRWTLSVCGTALSVRFNGEKKRVHEVVISVPLVPATAEDARSHSGAVLDEIELHEVGSFERFLRQRGLGYRPSTGDPELDDQFEIVTAADEGDLRRFFRRKAVREAILQLFAHQSGSLYIRESIVFRTPYVSVEPDVVDTLLALRAALSHVSGIRRRSRLGEVVALCVTVPPFVGGCFALPNAYHGVWGPLPEQMLNVGAKLGGVAIMGGLVGAIAGYAAGRLIRAKPKLAITLLGLWIFTSSLLAIVGLLGLNATVDTTVRWHTAEIVGMQRRAKRMGVSRILRLTPWGPATRPVELRVGERRYGECRVGAEVQVRTGEGAVGIAWRDRHSVRARP
jgi:uncharacterized membrane protein (Fun14 family)